MSGSAMRFHLASEIFELLTGSEFEALVEDIQKQGLINPIWLHPDGSILDGRNRYRACIKAEVEPEYLTWDGEGSAAEFVWSLNFQRRHLDGGAKQMAAARYALTLEAEARERQTAVLKRGDEVPLPQIYGNGESGRSSAKAAEKFGVAERTVESGIAVVKHGVPELGAAVEAGDVSVSAAADVATLPKAEQQEIVAKGEAEILEAAKRIRTERAEARRAENDALKAATPVPMVEGTYGTIVIDPPWDMQKIERDVRPNQVGFEYPTMTEEELASFPVPDMAADDCHLFCWTTQRFLPTALRLCEAWGFRYAGVLVWKKPGGFQPIGRYQYNCEFVIHATLGSPWFVDTKAFPAAFEAPRREHSRKPDEFYDTIRRVTGGGRIDVFSREPREGFEQFGNETGKFGD